jgi:cell division septation protein DedD
MSNEFPHEADDQMSAKKSSQQRLLLLLLLLVGLFAYLYFFTGLIRPRQDQPAPQPAPEAMVKTPLPPRPAVTTAPAGEPAAATTATETAPAGKPGAVAQAPTAAPAPAAKPGQPAAASAPAKSAAPEKSAKAVAPETKPAKTAAPPAKAKTEKPMAPAATAPGQAKAAKAAKPAAPAGQAKPATAAGKKSAAKPAAEADGAKKQAAAAKSAPAKSEKAKLAAKGGAPAYVLELNDDLLESETGSVTAKLKKAGITQVVKTKSQKGEPMHRLYLADFADRNEAVEQLERLKLSAPDAFMLRENGRYTVYAGSYLREGKAAVEQDRLYDKGVKLLLKSATAPVAVVKLRAGSFADQASAEKAAKNLKQAGLSAKVVKVAK